MTTSTTAGTKGARGWIWPRLCAHRGAGIHAPENTLAAMRAGAALGARMVEFDAKLTGDGVVILIHDDRLERTTDGHGAVARTSWADIARLDAGAWHSRAYAGETVPTLAACARWLNANGIVANIEIKPCPGREVETGRAVARAAARLWQGQRRLPLLTSFSAIALQAAARAAPGLPRGHLLERLPDGDAARMHLPAPSVQLLCVDHRALTRVQVAGIRARGLRLMVYTCNDARRAQRLFDWGIDCVITDRVERLLATVGN